MSNIRFGDARSRQSKIQARRTAESSSGKRRGDPSIHATSRPWHTSTPGIRMNVSTLGQIASRNPIAAQYLNRMNLSEMAQKKRGIAESNQGRGYDQMGQAIKRGTMHSVASRRAYGAPNKDSIERWTADIAGRERKMGETPVAARGDGWNEQMTHIRGLKKKIPKMPFRHTGAHNIYR